MRITNGYGDPTTRESLNDSADEAQAAHDLLMRLYKEMKG